MRYRSLQVAMAIVGLTACQPRTVIQDRPHLVSVPVATGCVSGDRPAPVPTMKQTIGDAAWKALTPRQKAAHLAAQSLRHQSRAQALDAATAGCR